MNNLVMGLYRYILDDVIKSIKPEFENEGLEDSVLHDLQQVCRYLCRRYFNVPSILTQLPSLSLSLSLSLVLALGLGREATICCCLRRQ
jgi:hypothetical protein